MIPTQATSVILGQRYKITGDLGRGGMGSVYKAYDRLTGNLVALKRLSAPAEQLVFSSSTGSTNMRLSLAGEFQTLASLRHPHIIAVLDYGFDEEKQPYFTMELLQDARTIMESGWQQPLNTQIRLLVEMLQALVYLHRRNIIHRDLKPGNVLTEDGIVKVLDFGLSIKRTGQAAYTDSPAGTLAYMAPELLRGEEASEASDLYAVGMIAFEMLAQRHPFDTSSITKLIDQVIYETPDVNLIKEANPQTTNVLLRLLAKSPTERYDDPGLVIRDLCQAAGIAVPRETVEIRESFIQGAQFVGREGELDRLSDVLRQAENSNGSSWLIGGESGVGKSRLLDELRTLCLVRGVLVLRGQSVSEGGRPYEVWRGVLRWLTLFTPLDDLEASVLKALIPDIETLLEHPVADAPTLEPQAAQERMLTVIENIFLRQTQPLLVILEDLHWAGSESLDVLVRLMGHIQQRPLVILASYRDDERPDLTTHLPGIQVLKLERLPQNSIAELSESMLGKGGRSPQVVKLLQQESEGNIFFLIEVVRALAQEAGDLSRISDITLPAKIFAGGIQRVVQRRLDHVPEQARRLLEIAAIIGRSLDLKVMQLVAANVDLENWLTTCANAAVLEVQGGNWRFAHDKLREGLLSGLTPENRSRLHEQVAGAIEQIDPQNAAPALTYHWHMAGNKAKEMQYAVLAGEQALQAGANREAISYFKTALDNDAVLTPIAATSQDRLRRAIWQRQLSRAHFALGEFRDGQAYLEEATRLLGVPMPRSSGQAVFGTLHQFFRQIFHRVSPIFIRQPREPELIKEAVQDYMLLAEAFYFARQLLQVIFCTLAKLNLSEMTNLTAELGHGYSSVAVAASLIPLHGVAETYNNFAYKIVPNVTEPTTLAYTLITIAVYEVGVGRWDKVHETLEKSIEISQRLGDQRRLGDALIILNYAAFSEGKYEESLHITDTLGNMALQNGNVQHHVWSLAVRYRLILRWAHLGYLEEVRELAQRVLSLSASIANPEPSHEVDAHGTLALVHLREGNLASALEEAKITLRLAAKSPATQSTVMDGHTHLCLALFGLLEAESDPAKKQELEAMTKKLMKTLPRMIKLFPPTTPAVYRLQGLYAWLENKQDDARSKWAQSLAEAEKLGEPYDMGIAHYELGRHLPASDPQRRIHLQQAIDAFTKLTTSYDLELAKRELNG